jgi:sigma-B regulation protein RsbU (phosphoserine phosphatase)
LPSSWILLVPNCDGYVPFVTGFRSPVFEHWDCLIEECQLFPGDTLLLYTHGVTEAVSQSGEEFGDKRLLETLQKHSKLSTEELLSAVARDIRQFSPGDQADDITVTAAKCA